MNNYMMWIGGEWVASESGKTYREVNPATGEEIAELPLGNAADVDKAVKAAQKAFPIWSGKTIEERSRILLEIADSLRRNSRELAELDIQEHGSPVYLAERFAETVPQHFENAVALSKQILESGESRITSSRFGMLQREPIGVCSLINPWNVPLMTATKIAFALATGNTCVAKPPSIGSMGPLKTIEIIAEHKDLPVGAVNMVTGPGGTVGNAMCTHPGVGMIAFTGSTEAGKEIMTAAGKTTKRLFLELGGKNPFIVLEDADIDLVVSQAVMAQFNNSGQICGSPGRYYIHPDLYDEFVEKFVQKAKNVAVGDPEDPLTQMGPLVSAEHRNKVAGLIKSGVFEGAKLVLGGPGPYPAPLDKGYYIVPTVLTDVRQNMIIAREEIFGPVAVFIKLTTEDDVIKLANDTHYGLFASIWTKNITRGLKMARSIQAGTVFINSHEFTESGFPWGGFKESGIGKEGSIMGLQEYTQVKVIAVTA